MGEHYIPNDIFLDDESQQIVIITGPNMAGKSALLRQVALIVLMAQTFNWSETRISAYLRAEGETMSPSEVRSQIQEGYRLLETMLPDDVRTIYLEGNARSGLGFGATSVETSVE